MKKKVRINPIFPIYELHPAIVRKVERTLSCGDIAVCIANRALVDEVFEDGKTLRLTMQNYNKDNTNNPNKKDKEEKEKSDEEDEEAKLKHQQEEQAKLKQQEEEKRKLEQAQAEEAKKKLDQEKAKASQEEHTDHLKETKDQGSGKDTLSQKNEVDMKKQK